MRSFQYLAVASQALFLAASAQDASSSKTRTGTVLSYYMPGFDPQQFVGSVIAADPTATTLKVQCAPGTDAANCGLAGTAEVTKRLPAEATGKTTFDGAYTNPAEPKTSAWHCRLRDNGPAKCDMTKVTGGVTALETGTADQKALYQTISVTGGMKKLREANASGTGEGSAASTMTQGGKAAASGSSSGAGPAPSSKSNAQPTMGAGAGALVAGLVGVAAIAL